MARFLAWLPAVVGVNALANFFYLVWTYAGYASTGVIEWHDAFLWLDQTFVNSMIFAMLAAVLLRSIPLFMFPVVVCVGEYVYNSRLLVGGLHGMLYSVPFYQEFFARHGTGLVNPQYGMIVAYVAVFAALLVTMFRKRWRTFDRFMALVCSLSVVVTFTLFHTYLQIAIEKATAREEKRIAYALSAADFAARCRDLDVICETVPRADVLARPETFQVDERARRTLVDVAKQGIDLREPFTWNGATDNNLSRTTFFAMGIAATSDGYVVGRSGKEFQMEMKFESLRYSLQASVAHVTWFLILVVLTWIHRLHVRKKVRQAFAWDAPKRN